MYQRYGHWSKQLFVCAKHVFPPSRVFEAIIKKRTRARSHISSQLVGDDYFLRKNTPPQGMFPSFARHATRKNRPPPQIVKKISIFFFAASTCSLRKVFRDEKYVATDSCSTSGTAHCNITTVEDRCTQSVFTTAHALKPVHLETVVTPKKRRFEHVLAAKKKIEKKD